MKMRTVIAAVVGLSAGLLGGAWSARGEIRRLRDEADGLRRERDRARRTKTAADLAMVARLGQAEQRCPPPERAPEAVPAPPAPAPAPTPAPAQADPPVRVAEPEHEPFVPPRDREQAFEEFAAEIQLRQDQRAAVRKLGAEFQRSVEEAIGGFLARFAVIEASGQPPRPREIAQASDRLLHTYLDADDKLRALLDEGQVDLLDHSDFDLVWLIDFESLSRMAEESKVR